MSVWCRVGLCIVFQGNCETFACCGFIAGTTQPCLSICLGLAVFRTKHGREIADNNNDAKDGVYYGVGAGLNINDNFNVDVMYKENKGKYEIGTKDYKADYRRVSLGVGYNFNLGQ